MPTTATLEIARWITKISPRSDKVTSIAKISCKALHALQLISFSLGQQMSYRHYWMKKYHSGAGISHYCAHFFTHIGFIAMDWTFAASAFILAELAMFQTAIGIFEQLSAAIAQVAVSLFITAIDGNHCRNSSLLLFYP